MFKVVRRGGMLSGARQPKIFATKDEAKAYAKEQRSYLTKTDRQYYRESYTVAPLTKKELAAIA